MKKLHYVDSVTDTRQVECSAAYDHVEHMREGGTCRSIWALTGGCLAQRILRLRDGAAIPPSATGSEHPRHPHVYPRKHIEPCF
jgi:hypothetical protein